MEKQQISFIQNLIVSYECALAIGNSLNLSEMLHEFIHIIVHKTNAHRGIIWVRNEENELQPVASAGIRLKDVLEMWTKTQILPFNLPSHQGETPSGVRPRLLHKRESVLGKQKFVIKNRDEKDFLQYCSIITGKEESILIVSINNVAILHLIYASREIVDEILGNMLAGLSRKLSVAIEACMAHENITKEIGIKKETKDKLQKLYTESEQSRKSLQSILEDVVEKEHTLQTSEEKYRMLIDNIQDGVFIIQDAKMQFVNEAFSRMVGYTVEEVIGMDFRELVAPEDLEMVADRYRRRQAGEDVPKEYEFRMLHKDKKTRVIVNMNVGLINYQGRVASMGTVKDITERKRAEQLEEAIFHIAQATNLTIGMDELFKYVHETIKSVMVANNFYIALYDEEQNLISFPYFVDEVDLPPPPEKLGKSLTKYVLRTRKPLYCDETTDADLRNKGEIELVGVPSSIWLGVPLLMTGKPIGIVVVQDYTNPKTYTLHDLQVLEYMSSTVAQAIQRKQIEEELRKSEEQFRLISENVADLIAVLDLEGRRVYNSPMYKNIIGNPDELRGTDSFQEIHPDDRDRIKAIFQETVRTGIGQRTEYRIVKQDGAICHIESQGSVIRDKDGKITNVVIVSRDVTEKKLLEQQFMRMQRMESIGTLAGGVAHDLNNVLAPILLSIEILKKAISDEYYQKILQTLEVSTRRGSDIVKQILGFARGVEGERTLLQLRHIIEDAISIIKETFPKSISVRQKIPKNIWTILGDSTQLQQVVMNLCVNARDAMPNGGSIKIFAENEIIDEQYAQIHIEAKPGHYVMLSIEDTGTGMPPDVVDRIFEPFFTTKEKGKGTGMGLSTVHTIVKSHKGFINVYSEVEKGTTFKVYIPAAGTEQVKASGFETKELLAGNGELILVVDDEASICEITKQTLETFGYRAVTASDGTEALAIYSSQGKDIALVITDIIMPVMDGSRTILALRKLNPAVKIIASSGLSDSEQTMQNDKYAADAFIIKPYTTEKLLETIHSVLHKKS